MKHLLLAALLSFSTSALADVPLLPIPSPLSAAAGGGGAGGVSGGGSGVANRVAFWTGVNSISSDANFTWNAAFLGINGAGSSGADGTGDSIIMQNTVNTLGPTITARGNATVGPTLHETRLGHNNAGVSATHFGITAADWGALIESNSAGLMIGTDVGSSGPMVLGVHDKEFARFSDDSTKIRFGTTADSLVQASTLLVASIAASGNAIVTRAPSAAADSCIQEWDSTETKQFYFCDQGSGGAVRFGLSGANLATLVSFQTSALGIGTLDATSMVLGTNNAARVTFDGAGTNATTNVTNIIPTTDNTGNVGTNANRYATVRAVAVTTGDLIMDARPEREAVWRLIEEDNRIVAVNEMTGEHFHIVMERE